MDLKVITPAGGIYIIKSATAFGPNGVIGHTASDSTQRFFAFADDDIIEQI